MKNDNIYEQFENLKSWELNANQKLLLKWQEKRVAEDKITKHKDTIRKM